MLKDKKYIYLKKKKKWDKENIEAHTIPWAKVLKHYSPAGPPPPQKKRKKKKTQQQRQKWKYISIEFLIFEPTT